jgi:hypothetical protein
MGLHLLAPVETALGPLNVSSVDLSQSVIALPTEALHCEVIVVLTRIVTVVPLPAQ